jgi:hypothetical protein
MTVSLSLHFFNFDFILSLFLSEISWFLFGFIRLFYNASKTKCTSKLQQLIQALNPRIFGSRTRESVRRSVITLCDACKTSYMAMTSNLLRTYQYKLGCGSKFVPRKKVCRAYVIIDSHWIITKFMLSSGKKSTIPWNIILNETFVEDFIVYCFNFLGFVFMSLIQFKSHFLPCLISRKYHRASKQWWNSWCPLPIRWKNTEMKN